jgi:deoxyribodipyrimidine photo-lyase
VWAVVRGSVAEAGGKRDSDGEKFLKEVLWREFSYHLLHHFPHLPETPFKPEFADFPWANNYMEALERWQKGLTGYPIVDAGMRELWATGYMHNRVRMIVSSFLIKDLLIPWQEGEKWFWDTLVDADIASNAASWQWVAGCGADAAPYFRIFNPVLQGEKFDPEGAYVRRWIPEISYLSNDLIHRPWEASSLSEKTYPKPIIDHHKARDRALAALKTIKASNA